MTRAARVAWWSPLPPLRTGVADYSYDLLEKIGSRLDVVAVVDDRALDAVSAPDGTRVVGAAKYLAGAAGRCDLDVYQMGNSFFHAFMHSSVLERPGLLTLHDPALVDLYRVATGGVNTSAFFEEARFNDSRILGDLPATLVDGEATIDRLQLLMSRRLAQASIVTAVHSHWAQEEMRRRFPEVQCVQVPMPAPVSDCDQAIRGPEDPVVFGVFGGLAPHKRVLSAIRAFALLQRRFPYRARLVIEGRSDELPVLHAARTLVRDLKLEEYVQIATDVPIDRFQSSIEDCDVVLALRWPTAGETSAVILRAFGAGKVVITSDVPQHGELDPTFCWKVPVDPAREVNELAELMRSACEEREQLAIAGDAARAFVERESSTALAASRYVALIEDVIASGNHRTRGQERSPVVNVFGDWEATTGLAEAGRRSAEALLTTGMDVRIGTFENWDAPRSRRRMSSSFRGHNRGHQGDIELWYLNINELHLVPDAILRPSGGDNYVVASWFWELPRITNGLERQLARVDEIWAGSRFTASCFRGYTANPIRVMPVPIEPQVRDDLRRHDFGLPSDACLFLFSFDVNSSPARKNPWGVVQAFRRAFESSHRGGAVRLVVKVSNLDSLHPIGDALAGAVADVGGILIDDELTGSEMNTLIGLCDVYVSLHRSEGFGMGMAEAMALGQPVIATAYSGNMDFMTATNSCLVGFHLRPIEARDHVHHPAAASIYEPGQLWAEPDIIQAARWMRRLWEDPELRLRVGTAGAATVRQRYSRSAAGAAMAARLREIRHERRHPGGDAPGGYSAADDHESTE